MVSGRRFFIILHNCRKPIAAAAHGLDQRRVLGIILDFVAQAADLHVDASVKRGLGFAVGKIEQLVARQNLLRVLGERSEQVKLGSAQVDQRLAGRGQAALGDVDAPMVKDQNPGQTVGRKRRARSGCGAARL